MISLEQVVRSISDKLSSLVLEDCPECHSHNLFKKPIKDDLKFALPTSITGIIYRHLPSPFEYKCNDCNYRWEKG